jgi:hypothetical protein
MSSVPSSAHDTIPLLFQLASKLIPLCGYGSQFLLQGLDSGVAIAKLIFCLTLQESHTSILRQFDFKRQVIPTRGLMLNVASIQFQLKGGIAFQCSRQLPASPFQGFSMSLPSLLELFTEAIAFVFQCLKLILGSG